ncbi:MAG: hypothetical protein ABII00_13495, partial [Elusimicrobiota bacterium]
MSLSASDISPRSASAAGAFSGTGEGVGPIPRETVRSKGELATGRSETAVFSWTGDGAAAAFGAGFSWTGDGAAAAFGAGFSWTGDGAAAAFGAGFSWTGDGAAAAFGAGFSWTGDG